MSDKRRTKRTENEQNNGIQFSPAFFDCLASKAKAVFFLLLFSSFSTEVSPLVEEAAQTN